MADKAIEIDWASSAVSDARVTVALTDKPSKDWSEAFERVLERLAQGDAPWGEVELGKRKLHVDNVEPGAEEDLRHLLESVVLQANASVGATDEEADDDEPSEQDAEMTDTFRSFASG